MKAGLMLLLAAVMPGPAVAGTLLVKTPPDLSGSVTLFRWNDPDSAVPLARIEAPGKAIVPDGLYGLSIGDFPFRHGPIAVSGEATIELAAFRVLMPKDAAAAAVAIFDRSSGHLAATLRPPGQTLLPQGRFAVRRDGSETVSELDLASGADHVEIWGALRLVGPPLAPIFALATGQRLADNKTPGPAADASAESSGSAGLVAQRIDNTARPFALPPGRYNMRASASTRSHSLEIRPGQVTEIGTTLLTVVDMARSKERQEGPIRIADAANGASIAWWDRTMPEVLGLIGHHDGRLAVERHNGLGTIALGTIAVGDDAAATVWIVPSGALAVEGDAAAVPVDFARKDPVVPGKAIRLAYSLPGTARAEFSLVTESPGEIVSLGAAVLSAGHNEIELMVPGQLKPGACRIVVAATLSTGERLAGRTSQRAIHRPIEVAPAGLRITSATATSLVLAWTPLDSAAGVAGYNLYRPPASRPVNGRAVITSAAYEDVGLGAGRAFAYRICAVDSLGIEGPCSEAVTGRTAPP